MTLLPPFIISNTTTGTSANSPWIANHPRVNGNVNIGASATRFPSSNGKVVIEIPANEETVKISGKLLLNEEDIDERLKRIEDMLYIPRRNAIMEQKYDKLKQLWAEYNETLSALKNWETLKESK